MFKLTWIFTFEPNIIIKINLNNKTYHIRSHQGCMPLYRFHIFRMDPKRHIFDHAALVKKVNVRIMSLDYLQISSFHWLFPVEITSSKNESFPLGISSVIVTKSAGNCRFCPVKHGKIEFPDKLTDISRLTHLSNEIESVKRFKIPLTHLWPVLSWYVNHPIDLNRT